MEKPKLYYFQVVCPKCGRETLTWASVREPEPTVNCGDCLMNHVEIVKMRVVKVRETSND